MAMVTEQTTKELPGTEPKAKTNPRCGHKAECIAG